MPYIVVTYTMGESRFDCNETVKDKGTLKATGFVDDLLLIDHTWQIRSNHLYTYTENKNMCQCVCIDSDFCMLKITI